MRALTLTQPWAGLVASGIKLIENRPRPIIKPADFGQPFAIHASREIKEDTYARIFEIAPELPGRTPAETGCRWHMLSRITSAVIGVATIDKAFTGDWDAETIARHVDILSDSRGALLGPQQVRWFFGPIGYVLRDVRALATPVPCRGALGFWMLPADVERAVTAQMEDAHGQ
jgi:hypothetical protein